MSILRLHPRTWHIETLFVGAVLATITFVTGGRLIEWIGSCAVLVGFGHASIGNRMAERQAARARPDVECYRWLDTYWMGKEILWVIYFVAHQSYAALVGCVVFILYPAWRRWWRTRHPLAVPAVDAELEAAIRHAEENVVVMDEEIAKGEGKGRTEPWPLGVTFGAQQRQIAAWLRELAALRRG